MPSRDLRNVNHDSREWAGGCFLPPMHIMEGGPYRPRITLWVELPELTVVACHTEDPNRPTPFAQTLREAMQRPLLGPPRRPRRVRVADALQAAELRAALPDLEVAIAPTPEVERVARDFAERFKASAPERGGETYLDNGRIPAAAVARLFEAAKLLYVVAPWKTAADDQVLRVDIPQLAIKGSCLSIIGALGQNLGFILFPSLERFEAFQELARRKRTPGAPLDLGTTILSLNFDRGADLPPSMRCEIAEHGWPVAGPHAYPQIDHVERDGLRRPLAERDLRLVSAVATSLSSLFVKHGSLAGAEANPICESWSNEDGLTVRFTAPYDAARLFAENAPQPENPCRPVDARRSENAPRPSDAPAKIGRNHPCPCGSGKKYKKCCLSAAESQAARPSPVHQRDQDFVAELRRYAMRRFGEKWVRAARDFHDPAQMMELFVPWSVYVFEIEGRPVVDWFLEDRGARLGADERAWLIAQQRTWLSIWEVVEVEPGKSVTVRDLLSGEERRVHEVRGSAMLVERDAILGRVVDHEDVSVFCGIHPRALPPFEAADVLRRARSKLRRQRAVPVEKLRNAAFGRFLIARWEETVAELDARALIPPRLSNTDGHTDPRALAQRAQPEAPISGLPPEEQQALIRRLKNRHYRDWPDQPLPALAGKTPREAARTRRGRDQVDLLLRQFEHHEGRLPAAERFDISSLRALLGLED